MSRYQPLSDHLAKLKPGEWRTSFTELEKVLGFALPQGARTRSAWWSNPDAGHVTAWTAAGWAIDALDVKGEEVAFRRVVESPAEAEPTPDGRTLTIAGHEVPVRKVAIGAGIVAGAAVLLTAAGALARAIARRR
jgi:hypothetical protein